MRAHKIHKLSGVMSLDYFLPHGLMLKEETIISSWAFILGLGAIVSVPLSGS